MAQQGQARHPHVWGERPGEPPAGNGIENLDPAVPAASPDGIR
jgi:hypothetical protein